MLFVPLLMLYVPVFFITTKLYVLRQKYWDELALIVIHFVLSSYFYTDMFSFFTFYTIGYAIQGLYLGIMIGVNHFTMPRVRDTNTDWFQWQISSTCNWNSKSTISRYLSGFLNLQIEHHIAPTVPPQNYIFIQDDLKDYVKNNQLQYIVLTFTQAFWNMIVGLKHCADKELSFRHNLVVEDEKPKRT